MKPLDPGELVEIGRAFRAEVSEKRTSVYPGLEGGDHVCHFDRLNASDNRAIGDAIVEALERYGYRVMRERDLER